MAEITAEVASKTVTSVCLVEDDIGLQPGIDMEAMDEREEDTDEVREG